MSNSSQPPKETPNDLGIDILDLSIEENRQRVLGDRRAVVDMDNRNTPPRAPGSAKGGDEGHHHTPKDSKGWDGKLRVEKKTQLANPEAISDAEYSDDENVLLGEALPADEGEELPLYPRSLKARILTSHTDLLEDEPDDVEEIDAIHSRIATITSLHLERFKQLRRLCLRQNVITEIEGLSFLAESLEDLDLYDNLLKHIRGLEDLTNLTSLDLSFNKIKHIKNVNHLKKLTDLYFVQNKISTIENLDGLTKLRNLELAANRIREVQNLETLTGLEELWLGKNKIVEMNGFDTLSNLKILSIQSNRIREISGLKGLTSLEELYISHNGLTTLNGLEDSQNLRILDISNNGVSSLKGLGHLEKLEELWASYNQIGDVNEVERELADKKDLTTVYFEGNPLQLRQPALYRNKVRLTLPQVMQIDASKSLLFSSVLQYTYDFQLLSGCRK